MVGCVQLWISEELGAGGGEPVVVVATEAGDDALPEKVGRLRSVQRRPQRELPTHPAVRYRDNA